MRRVALWAMMLVACEQGAEHMKDTTAGGGQPSSAVSSAQPSAGISQPTAAPCRPTGSWAVCNVMDRLDRAGLVPRADTVVVSEPPLTVRGAQILVGKGELELYVYPDNAAREREQRLLDKTKYVSFDAPLTMLNQPTLITSANLLAVLHSRNDHLRERVADAITAGPPQPPSNSKP